jgi:hypothetical protein
MPHLKCAACKSRMYSFEGSADTVGGPCPGCGSPLEPVVHLAEIVGFRAISSDRSRRLDAGGGYRGLAARIDRIRARRAGSQPLAPYDASRWLDDGEGLPPEPMAEAMAVRKPYTQV